MPRSTSLTPDAHRAIVESLRRGMTRSGAAAIAGVTDRTLRSWMERGREGEEPFETFLLDVQRAEGSIEETMTISLLKLAVGDKKARPDVKAIQFWLERRIPEYRQKTEVNIESELRTVLDAVETVCGAEMAEKVLARIEEERTENDT